MNHHPGSEVPATGIYWCTVCKLPRKFSAGERFGECPNLCARGLWQLVERQDPKSPERG
jgi:hypothetical protein